MANYNVQVANPRRKKAKKKAGKRKTKKKGTKKKATKKRGKKKAAKRKTKKKVAKRKTKKKATKKRGKKKTAKRKTKKKAAKRKTAKKAAPKRKKARKRAAPKRKRKPKKNPHQSWTLLSSQGVADKYGVKYTKGKWILRKGGRVLEGPMTATQMTRFKAGPPVSTGTRLKRARDLAAGRGGGTAGKKRLALKAVTAEGKALVRLTKDIEETKTELGGEARALAEAVQRLTKARRKDKNKLADLEAQVKAAKARASGARKRGDLSKKDEERLQDRLSRAQAALKRCRVALKDAKATAPAKRKATKKKASKKKATKKRGTRKKAPSRGRRRKPSWPSNVPRPGFPGVPERLTVEQAIHRLTKAGQYLRHGASASGRRMQLASKGYLQLNPLEDIPGHPGLVAQFKSDKATRARAVAAKTPRSVKPKGNKPVKGMTARERQAILRRALRGT